VLLLLLACAPEDTGRVVVAGDYTFSPDGEGSGSCGATYADAFFVTTSPTTVTLAATDDGFEGQDDARTADGFGHLVCVGEDDFTCTLYDGSSEAADSDATTTDRADAEGRWRGDTELSGNWTLASSCIGDDCPALAGIDFPCTWTQPFVGSL
jgi:hypothetical protein